MSLTEAAASVAARAFFYPSLAWNIARNRLQDTWHWWDEITPNVVLGAIPFYSTLEELKKLGVQAVVTLNETFEVFITTEQYQDSGFKHLHIPTVDFLYAPPTEDLHRGADFIHEIAADGGKTYVHCKAGRGRSTTLVLCYLVKYCGHTPEEAYTFVRERRPQVYLAQGQWTAVCGFYISCHPGDTLKAEDFPYPTLLPLAPGKQGSDGVEASIDMLKPVAKPANFEDTPSVEAAAERNAASCASQEEPRSTEKGPDDTKQAVEGSRSHDGSQQTLDGGSTHLSRPSSSAEDSSCSRSNDATTLYSGLHPSESDDVVVLSSVGSTVGSTTDSDLSLGSIATALSTCCIHPRLQQSTVRNEPAQLSDVCPPQRCASPAIEIPRGQSPVPQPVSKSATPSPSPGSKASITLEPSGSLPGYIRVAPAAPKHASAVGEPVIRATLTSTGFTPIDDWADLGIQNLHR